MDSETSGGARALGDLMAMDLTEVLRSTFAAAPAFIIVVAPDGRIVFVNKLVPGLTMDQVRGRSVYDFAEPSSHELMRASIARVVATGEPGSYRIVGAGPHGQPRHYETNVAPILEHGVPIAVVLVSLDRTEDFENARALAESREQLRVAVEATGMGLWTWNVPEDRITWDARMREIFGVGEAAAPKKVADYVPLIVPGDRPLVDRKVRRAAEEGETEISEYRIVRGDGAVRWIQVRGKAIRDDKGQVARVVGGTLDITERKLAEARSVEAQKLSAMGQLTAGVAHNLNNILMAIIPNLELAPQLDPVGRTQALEQAHSASLRAAEIIRQLLVFARQAKADETQDFDVRDAVLRAVSMCRGAFDARVVVETRVGDRPIWVHGHPGRLEQSFVNVLLNARDALRGVPEPRLGIEVAALELVGPDSGDAPGEGPRPFASVSFRDTGMGMSEETRKRIFEPFFTTKPAGLGTGLGLSTTYAIVKDHGGSISVDSAPGVGTRFTILFPALDPQPGSEMSSRPQAHAVAGGRERILVVDDDPDVRKVVSRILELAGYGVDCAADAETALSLLSADGYDLVLLDISLPGMSGLELGRSVKGKTRARVVYFSGYPGEAADENLDVITKPVTRDELLQSVRRILDGGRAADRPS